MIVFDDADIEQALNAAHIGLFLNHGQCCCASSRLFVQEGIYDEFVKRATALAAAWKCGDPSDENTMQGPQVDKIQFDRVMNYIDAGKASKATLNTGGNRHGDTGYFIQPTVFSDCTDDMKIVREEIFGPVMCIMKFKTIEEVITRANDTNYGLAAGICTRDVGKAIRVSNSLRAGTVWVNTYNAFDCASPFGGYKESGSGRELGEYGLENYTEIKSVIIPIDR